MISVAEAQALILAEAHSFGTEIVSLEKSFGRVLAQEVRADRDYPPFNRSAMDGYAVVAGEFSPGGSHEITKTVFAGDKTGAGHAKEPATKVVKIMTGAAVPSRFDAVIRSEDANVEGKNVSFKISSAKAWQNISKQGEDLKKNQLLHLRGRNIDSATASLLASLGVVRPRVAKLPRVAIISTGNEIIQPNKKPGLTQIRNANVTALRVQLAQSGIHTVAAIHVPDNRAKLKRAIAGRGKFDILLLTGGVSAGDTDYVPEVLAELKYRKLFHKVQMKPGKPLWFGIKGKTVVFAIPGNPFSCQVVFKVFIEPFLHACFGLLAPAAIHLPLEAERVKKDFLQNYFPVRINTANKNGASALSAIPFNSSGDVRAALFSDGIARHSADVAKIEAGMPVEFFPWRSRC